MQQITPKNIVDGKRKRIMSTEAVLACVASTLASEGGKQKKNRAYKRKIPIQLETESDDSVQEVDKPSKKKDEKVKISKAALKELISQHFMIIEDEEQKQLHSRKIVKTQKQTSPEESSNQEGDESSSEEKPKRQRLHQQKH